MTNREWLNSLSDEELGKILDIAHGMCKLCAYRNINCLDDEYTCSKGHLEWLKAEHKEEENG